MKKISIFLTLIFLCLITEIKAQTGNVGIGTLTPDASAVLDIQSTDKGLLIPRMTNAQISAIASPAVGLQVYSLDDKCIHRFNGIKWLMDCALEYNGSALPPVDSIWTQLNDFPPMFSNRYGYISFAINGEAYVGTGRNAIFNKDLWKYDPLADSWTQLNDFPAAFLGRRDAVTFTIGGEVYVGTGQVSGFSENDLWKYDPVADNWTQLNDFPFGGTREAIAFTINDVAYVGTGSSGVFRKDLWKYDPIADSWIQLNDFPLAFEARADAVAFSLGDIAYVGTGNKNSPLKDFWKYDSTSDSWTQLNDFPHARYAVTSFVLNGEAYIATGQTGLGSGFQKGLYKYNAAAENWIELTDFPAGFGARSSAIAFTLDNSVYLGTGLGVGSLDLWKYEPNQTSHLLTINPNGDATWIDPNDNNLIDIDDADADPTNELQDWNNLPGIPTDFSDGTDAVNDADFDPTNELQDWSNLPGIPAAFDDDMDDVNDADSDPNNELITTAILNGTDLEITDAGGTKIIDLSSLTGMDSTTVTDSDNIDFTLTNNDISAQVKLDVVSDNILTSSTNGLKAIEDDPEVGANTTNYLPKWDGSALVQSSSVFEDGNGNVGIGTSTPDGPLEVEVPGFSEEVIEQTVWTQWSPFSTDIWQSFYLVEGGYLTSVDFATSITGPVTVSLYFGYGNISSGNLLYSETVAAAPFVNSLSSPLVLPTPWNLSGAAGQYLTLRIQSTNGGFFGENTTNPYSGGESNLGAGHDYQFRITVDEPASPIDALLVTPEGDVGIGRTATTNKLEVEGEASKTTAGSWVGNSDKRLKKDIKALNSQDMLQQLLALQGVTYQWNDNKTGSKRPEGIQYGFIAQNIQTVFPSLVAEDNLGYLQAAYGTYDAMTVEAIRALNQKIENLDTENNQLKTQVSSLQTKLTEMDQIKQRMAKLEAVLQAPEKSISNISEK